MTVRNLVREFGRGFMALAANRMELFGIELREEQERFIKLLLTGLFSLMLLAMAVAMLLVSLLLFVEPETRPWVSLAIGGVFLVATLICWLALQRAMNHAEPPFAVTRRELKKDCGID